ncbi:hypothetical protein [Duganella sp. S19_KUP01_CR8]|uniref:hypothetical protein n=1 Tax=Duganella sp. S19_KUP01_CR8 TaxID=3025502 RepID=UPI002FCD70D7
MKNRYVAIFLIAVIGALILVRNFLFYESTEITVLAPTNVNLNSGWPNDQGNHVIGVLSAGNVFKVRPMIVDDHMVYKVEFQSPAGIQTGFLMFDGYCGSSIVETRIRHYLFKKNERISVDCRAKK